MTVEMRRGAMGVVLLSFAACASEEEVRVTPEEPCAEVKVTYYADEFAGRKTASGETYDPQALTAAHRHFAFGTELELTYKGKSAVLRVNDRGPFVSGVTLDVSRAVAEKLGILRAGRARVHMCWRQAR